jgi:2-succinyl-5-enolpyruvyl-6-hydroxy-3-cyclohexene-1-carboxylate synthase
MEKLYTNEVNVLIIISLLKNYGIRKVIASPGTTNMALVASMQQDDFFEMYSSVDERSAAYMACGMSAESGQPVVISCTGATASRNYLPGMTEAFYRKLPLLVITSTQRISKVGHHIAQITDRSQLPKDVANLSLTIPIVKDNDDLWDCELKVNQALLELSRRGGGPVHLNLQTLYSREYNTKVLPDYRRIYRFYEGSKFPDLPEGKIGIFVGSHRPWSKKLIRTVEEFCDKSGAVVFCDHTSGYNGRYRVLSALLAGQKGLDFSSYCPDLLIHIGEITGDYYGTNTAKNKVWRVNPDGMIRDTFRKLESVFEMSEEKFFEYYSSTINSRKSEYLRRCTTLMQGIREKIPEVPFSNIWLASKMANRIPDGSVVHFGILNSLRAWNFFELSDQVESASNVGGFGIDGNMSSVIGASLCNPQKLYYCVIGDLAFFYDMNSLGNRHLNRNLRILLVNNGNGTEFRQYGHLAESFGENASKFISAGGHFGNQSATLVKNYAENLGFEYFSSANKDGFLKVYERFFTSEITEKPILFEVFTNSEDESKALEMMVNIRKETVFGAKSAVKDAAKGILGNKGIAALRKSLGK